MLCLVSVTSAARAGDIVAGPMVGHVTDTSARLWMQLSVAKQVSFGVYELNRAGAEVSRVTVDVEGPTPYVCDTPLNNLQPNKSYRIEVKLDGEPAELPGPGVVIRTAPAPGEEATFSVAFGSGVNARGLGTATIFKAVEAVGPRAFFFLGDSGYLPEKLDEYPTQRRAAFRFIAENYSRARREPDLQNLFRTTPCYAIWGAHDFGGGSADKDWVFAKESQAVFQHFWPNPTWGQLADPELNTPDNPACYFSFSMGDVDFFMLDARMFRETGKTMLGDVQLDWLKRSLKKSHATFKIIASSTPLLADYGTIDSWARFPEQPEFLRWISENHIPGLLFITGADRQRPYGELSVLRGKGYPLFELTSAVLAGPEAGSGQVMGSSRRVEGGLIVENNFGTLDFGGTREHRFVTLRLRNADRTPTIEQTLYAVQLK